MSKINIYLHDEVFEGKLGTVIPPENTHLGKQDPEHYWCVKITDLWEEWKQEVEFPDSDSQFINWLVDQKGFTVDTEDSVDVFLN